MVRNNVIEMLTVGDYLVMADGQPELTIDLMTGRGMPQVLPAENAQELLYGMANSLFESRFLRTKRNAFCGTVSDGRTKELSMVRITPENLDTLCIQTMAMILNRAANPDPLEEKVRMMLIEGIERLMSEFGECES